MPGEHGMLLGRLALHAVTGFASLILLIGGPVILALVSVEIMIAFLSRLLPGINMLLAAAPARVAAMWIFIFMAAPDLIHRMERGLEIVLRLLSGGGHV